MKEARTQRSMLRHKDWLNETNDHLIDRSNGRMDGETYRFQRLQNACCLGSELIQGFGETAIPEVAFHHEGNLCVGNVPGSNCGRRRGACRGVHGVAMAKRGACLFMQAIKKLLRTAWIWKEEDGLTKQKKQYPESAEAEDNAEEEAEEEEEEGERERGKKRRKNCAAAMAMAMAISIFFVFFFVFFVFVFAFVLLRRFFLKFSFRSIFGGKIAKLEKTQKEREEENFEAGKKQIKFFLIFCQSSFNCSLCRVLI
jgi:hypothetical protein